ncbi:MAG: malonyl-CoA decarboxylase [Pseudomonadota bacterium]
MARNGYFANLLSTVFDQRRIGRVHDDTRSIIEQSRDLIAATGETAILRTAASVLSTYGKLTTEEKNRFFRFLVDELDIDAAQVAEAALRYGSEPTSERLSALFKATEPSRQTLFRNLNHADGATAQLVALRQDLLAEGRNNADYAKIDLDLVHLFTSWFNRGFLVLRPIDWYTPAEILEKIIAYEAVHQINDWDDLRRRLKPDDRRCYAYFHPRMPDDPLIFVEIALSRGIPESIQSVLSEDREPIAAEAMDTAVFYSISNCQPGLYGISFGEFLIKHVVADLSDELPQLKEFVTLSPIPGLRQWVETADGIDPELIAALSDTGIEENGEVLRSLAAHYLADVKRGDGLPRDPVARFHLSNGAEIHNLLASADLSDNGVRQSFGAMVNYRYDVQKLEENSEAFATENAISVSRPVQALRRGATSHLGWEGAAA